MIDVVANNFAYAGPGQDTVFSDFVPFNKAEYFHPFCYITDYSNATNAQWVCTLQEVVCFSLTTPQCWLGDDSLSLPDMDTENDFVKATWDQWAKDVVANYSGWSRPRVGTDTADRNS